MLRPKPNRLWLPPKYRRGVIGLGMKGCGCIPCCTLFQDDFQRPDSEDLGGVWEQFTGDFEIAGGRLKADAAGIVIHDNDPDNDSYKLSVNLAKHVPSDTVALIGWWGADGTSQIGVELQTTGATFGTVRLYRAAGGFVVESDQREVTTSPDKNYILTVCRNGETGDIVATIDKGYGASDSAVTMRLWSDVVAGTKFGLRTGFTCTGAEFDDYTVTKVNEKCASCQACSMCPGGSKPVINVESNFSAEPTLTRSFTLRRYLNSPFDPVVVDRPCCYVNGDRGTASDAPAVWVSFAPAPHIGAELAVWVRVVAGDLFFTGTQYWHFVKEVESCFLDGIEITQDDFYRSQAGGSCGFPPPGPFISPALAGTVSMVLSN